MNDPVANILEFHLGIPVIVTGIERDDGGEYYVLSPSPSRSPGLPGASVTKGVTKGLSRSKPRKSAIYWPLCRSVTKCVTSFLCAPCHGRSRRERDRAACHARRALAVELFNKPQRSANPSFQRLLARDPSRRGSINCYMPRNWHQSRRALAAAKPLDLRSAHVAVEGHQNLILPSCTRRAARRQPDPSSFRRPRLCARKRAKAGSGRLTSLALLHLIRIAYVPGSRRAPHLSRGRKGIHHGINRQFAGQARSETL